MNITAALVALASKTDPTRAARAGDVKVDGLKLSTFDGAVVEATALTGEGGKYVSRISFLPRRAVACTCPDAHNRKVVCKHVSALAGQLADLVC